MRLPLITKWRRMRRIRSAYFDHKPLTPWERKEYDAEINEFLGLDADGRVPQRQIDALNERLKGGLE